MARKFLCRGENKGLGGKTAKQRLVSSSLAAAPFNDVAVAAAAAADGGSLCDLAPAFCIFPFKNRFTCTSVRKVEG